MKIYYIDGSLFQKSEFALQTLYRFERYVQKKACDVILISTSKEEDINMERFKKMLRNVNFLVSPCSFDIEGVRGTLSNTHLMIENLPSIQTYSGSFVSVDSETGRVERIYLEMFMKYDFDIDYIVQEMEQVLQDKIIKMKKKSIMN